MAVNYVVIPDGFVEVAFIYSVPGQSGEVITTCGFEVGTDTSQGLLDDLSDAWAHVKTFMPTVTRYEGLRARVQAGLVGSSVSSAGAGANAGAVAPPNMSYLFRKTTSSPGRQNMGRMYFPGVLREEVDGLGVLTGGAYTAAQSGVDTAVADATSAFGNPVLLHTFYRDLKTGQVPRPDTTPTLIDNFVLETKVATQRTRLRD